MARIWFIADTHFGVRNDSQQWVDIQRSYFFDWFFPKFAPMVGPDDVLVHAGDSNDNRRAVGIPAYDLCCDVFERASTVFSRTYVLVGNHDIWEQDDTRVNSVRHLGWLPRVEVVREPRRVTVGSTELLLMPWRKDADDSRRCVRDMGAGCAYLVCHTDVMNVRFNRNTIVSHGPGLDDFTGFRRVYGGHIHYAQRLGNVTILGSPYEMTRADVGNLKGVIALDPDTDVEEWFENDHSPRFLRADFYDLMEMDEADAAALFRNNFVDVMVPPGYAPAVAALHADFGATAQRVEFLTYTQASVAQVVDPDEVEKSGHASALSITDLFESYVRTQALTEEDRLRMIADLTARLREAETG